MRRAVTTPSPMMKEEKAKSLMPAPAAEEKPAEQPAAA
jgi:small subunit ribosomal protein S6